LCFRNLRAGSTEIAKFVRNRTHGIRAMPAFSSSVCQQLREEKEEALKQRWQPHHPKQQGLFSRQVEKRCFSQPPSPTCASRKSSKVRRRCSSASLSGKTATAASGPVTWSAVGATRRVEHRSTKQERQYAAPTCAIHGRSAGAIATGFGSGLSAVRLATVRTVAEPVACRRGGGRRGLQHALSVDRRIVGVPVMLFNGDGFEWRR
jgi:hypothetical protein